MKKLLLLLTFLCSWGMLCADEGMWIPMLLNRNQADMQALGMKITAEDIYSIEHSSLKDAVVIFGRGCTGEIVSDQGLLLTNHHCGYGQIQYHSSLEHDYLTNGFWAASLEEELPCPGLTATLLISMREVTDEVLGKMKPGISEIERGDIIQSRIRNIVAKAEKNTRYKARVVPFYHGNQYFLFINEIFEDVRLVGTPPSNIGKFGGDTDNWMWPRHTGDFSVFRIYANAKNEAAPYSPANRPYQPKRFLKIDISGVEENDFTFVFGYPGRTYEYLTSFGVRAVSEVENPIRIEARTERLNLIKGYVEKSPLIRIQYAAKYAGIANGWKKWIGQNKGLERLNALETKRAFERDFQKWTETAEGKAYAHLLEAMDKAYREMEPLTVQQTVYQEHILAPEVVNFANKFSRLIDLSQEKKAEKQLAECLSGLQKSAADFFKDYNAAVDRTVFEHLIWRKHGEQKELVVAQNEKTIESLIQQFYAQSIFTDEKRCTEFLAHYQASQSEVIENDPLFRYASEAKQNYEKNLLPSIKSTQAKIDSLQRVYMKAQMEMRKDFNFYPDANFTLRVAYGQVKGFSPADAVNYKHYTTIEGIMEKENPAIYDYVVEDKLKDLYLRKDYGDYANARGELPVCFIATNHTTGGNSGSPVMNAQGHLIGLNFDRNWEGTMSDIMYSTDQSRNITLDIRYCLFIIDKFAGARRLIDEMEIVR